MRYLSRMAYSDSQDLLTFDEYDIKLEYDKDHFRIYKVTKTSKGEKFLVVALRGTMNFPADLITDFELVRAQLPPRFISTLVSLRDWLEIYLQSCRIPIIFTGHSLGASEAQFLAVELGGQSVVFENPGCANISKKEYYYDDHLTYNGPGNIINSAASLFTGGPIGSVESPQSFETCTVDILTALLFLLSYFILISPEVNGAMVMLLMICVLFTYGSTVIASHAITKTYYENSSVIRSPLMLPPVHLIVMAAVFGALVYFCLRSAFEPFLEDGQMFCSGNQW